METMGVVQAINHSPKNPFRRVVQIEAGVLDVGYVDAGPTAGPAVILLHGWPYDIHSYAEVTTRLASAGYRVIVPYLRGYGTTRFLSETTLRNWGAGRARAGHHRVDGRPRDRRGDHRRL
jgi:pimeloyl-ACP methyl ester carboxylesterase